MIAIPPRFLDTPAKRSIMYSFVLFYPLMSLLAGAPLPFPSLFDVSAEQIALLNFGSLLVTLVGSIIGVGFYLEKRQNNKIERLENQVDEGVIALKLNIKELYHEMKEMKRAINEDIIDKLLGQDKSTDLKVSKAKELADQKIEHMEDITRDMRKDIQAMERGYHQSNRYSRKNEEREDTKNEKEYFDEQH
jgi:hypothetical protein